MCVCVCVCQNADSVKRKYFRIEENKTAPAGAEWSQENVKRRLVEKKEGEEREMREVRKQQGIVSH